MRRRCFRGTNKKSDLSRWYKIVIRIFEVSQICPGLSRHGADVSRDELLLGA
jgi:hypothetical protein